MNILIILGLVALGLMFAGWVVSRLTNEKLFRTLGFGAAVLVLLIAAIIGGVNTFTNASADQPETKPPPAANGPADVNKSDFKCDLGDPNQLADPPQYGTDHPNAQDYDSNVGPLKGDGPNVDISSQPDPTSAINHVWILTGSSPLVAAKLAIALHLPGFIPDGVGVDSNELPATFINTKAVDLLNHRDKWGEVRKTFCSYLQFKNEQTGVHFGDLKDDGNPIFQMATKVGNTDVVGTGASEPTTLPVSDVNIKRPNDPPIKVLWILGSRDLFSADNPMVHSVHQVGIDLSFGWVTILGTPPQDAVNCKPVSPDMQQQNQQKQDNQNQANQQAASAAQANGNGGSGGSNGGSGGHCGSNTCGGSGGSGGGCQCPGATPTTPCNCTPPSTPSESMPPPSTGPPVTTGPPTTFRPPPTTSPPPPPTTKPPTTTTTTIQKSHPTSTTIRKPCDPTMDLGCNP